MDIWFLISIKESLTAIVDCFRVALQNCGNDRVVFSTSSQMKRRKSRTHALDIPSGMQRNLSDNQLVQAGSKAVSNVAEQFSKFGQSLNPRILTGKKTTSSNSNNSTMTPAETASDARSTIKEIHDGNICESDGNDSSKSSAPDSTNKYNDNSFLQSVGIVMVDATEMAETQNQSETRKSSNMKNLENVARISISSVTDNVKLPPEMLQITDLPEKSCATPEITVQETDDGKIDRTAGMKMCHSVADMRSSDSVFGEDSARYDQTNLSTLIIIRSVLHI